MSESARRRAALVALFAVGTIPGLLAWEAIRLPVDNPWEVAGGLARTGHGAPTNSIRFACLMLLSVSAAGVLLLPGARGLARLCFGRGDGQREQGAGGRTSAGAGAPLRTRALLALVFAIAAASAGLLLPSELSEGPLDTFHEGESLGPAALVEQGAVPYRDFIPAHGPFADPLRANLAFAVMDRSIAAVRTLQSVLKLAAMALAGVLAASLFAWRALPASTLLAGFVFLNLAPMLPQRDWSTLTWVVHTPRDLPAFAFLLVALGLHRALAKARPTDLRVASLCALFAFIPVAAFAYSTDRGFFLCAAWVLLLAALRVAHPRTARTPVALGSLSGAAAGAGSLLALLGEGAAAWFEFALLIQPRYWDLLAGRAYTLACPHCIVPLLLVCANSFWLALRFAREWSRGGRVGLARRFGSQYFVEIALYVVSLLFFRSALGRADLPHIAIGSSFVYLLSLFIALAHIAPAHLRSEHTRRGVGVVLSALLGLGAIASAPERSPGAILERNFPWGTPDAALVPADYRATAEFLVDNLAKDESFYTLTSEGIWYYLTRWPCPTRFPIAYYAAPSFYQAEIVRDLGAAKPKYVIGRSATWSMRIDGIGVAQRLPAVAEYVDRHYRPLRRIGRHEIWERKPAVPVPVPDARARCPLPARAGRRHPSGSPGAGTGSLGSSSAILAISALRSIGLVTKSSQPAAMQRSRSPVIACAVRATIGPL